jgi:hypothetical protein
MVEIVRIKHDRIYLPFQETFSQYRHKKAQSISIYNDTRCFCQDGGEHADRGLSNECTHPTTSYKLNFNL